MIIQQLSIFLEDNTGSLAKVTGILAQHGINMSAFCVADATDYGILRMVVGNSELALSILRHNNYSVHVNEVLCLKLQDVSGSLNRALKVLSANGLGVDYMYAYASASGVAIAVLHGNDNSKMIKVLQDNKMELLCADDII